MPAYKDKERNTWYCQFRYKDAFGSVKKITRRGFRLKKEAEQYEAAYKLKHDGSCSMLFTDLVDLYLESKEGRIRDTTIAKNKNMINKHLRPFFGDFPVNKITPALILDWQKSILKQNYSATYQRTLSNTLSSIFNHAIKFYNLPGNPIHKSGHIGKEKAEEMQIWTEDQFNAFITNCKLDDMYKLILTALFWTGLRIGELLALTPTDYVQDGNNMAFSVNKTLVYVNGNYIVNPPKTEKSKRLVQLPVFLVSQINDYIKKQYDLKPQDRLFPVRQPNVNYNFKAEIARLEMPQIRVHDLRHSHASMLLSKGINIVNISKRLGHEKIEITLNIYSHLRDDDYSSLIDCLDNAHQHLT